MITVTFFAFLAFSAVVALVDWRRGWLMAIVCGVLQDPARKLTPGTPVVMTFSIVVVYFVILFAAQHRLQESFADLTRRFPRLYLAGIIFVLFLFLAAANGLMTYGVAYWKVPALSLFIYLVPITAVLVGYTYMEDEERLYRLFRFYAILTSVAMIGTPLEHLRVQWNALGMVALPEGYIRHLPGIQIRILSGFYRAPDIMGWHAAMLTSIGIVMAMRARALRAAWPWMLAAGWGFFNCMISGRRKAIYMVAVFALAFLWRYFRRLTITQVVTFLLVAAVLGGVVRKIAQDEEASVYAKGAATTEEEILQRLEGGFTGTVEQFGIMGAGLGTATQGVRHLLGRDQLGWQEGGLGKLTVELGVPGLLATALLAWVLFRTMMRLSWFPDEPGSSQLLRAALFGIIIANIANFMVSAQAYSDAVLTLMTAFFLGCFLGTATLNEKFEKSAAAIPQLAPATA